MPGSVTTTSSTTLVQAAFDRYVRYALRPRLFFDQLATVRPTNQSMPGSSVTFTIMADLAFATTPLSETTDVNAVALSDSTITVTLAEYGNAVVTTKKLRALSYVPFDPIVADIVAFNAAGSIDTVARNSAFDAGSGAIIDSASDSHTTAVTIASTDVIKAANVRYEYTQLRNNFVADFGGLYNAFVHPDVVQDLRSETGSGAWRTPHEYAQPAEIWNGEIGEFEGFLFISTPRCKYTINGGAGSAVSVYYSLFSGMETIAKIFSTAEGLGADPVVVLGPVTDTLRRLQPYGWFHLVGYAPYRQSARRQLFSAATNNAQS